MPRKPISFDLDFMIKDIFPRFVVKQFDDVSFNIKPKNQGQDYNTTNMTCKIFVGVNDDMFLQTTGITVSSNNISVMLDRNMLQKQGRAYAEIELTDQAGTITSSSFLFDIDPKIGEGGMIPGEYEGFVSKYEKLIAEFRKQVDAAIQNNNASVDLAIKRCNDKIEIKITNCENRMQTIENTFDSLVDGTGFATKDFVNSELGKKSPVGHNHDSSYASKINEHTHTNKSVIDGITSTNIDSWNGKVDKVTGKGLSTNDYTTTEKNKLSGIQDNANNYAHPANHTPSIIVQDASNRFVTDTEKSTWNGKANTTVATTSANGLMSSSDKTKLDGVANNANNYTHTSTHPASIITMQDGLSVEVSVSALENNLAKSVNTKYTTTNGTKEFTTRDGYIDNIAIAGQTKILDANNNVVAPGTAGARLVSVGQGDKIEVLTYSKTNNLIPSNATYTDNSYLNYATGQPTSLNTHKYINEYITVEPNELYLLIGCSLHFCVYDSSKNIISTDMPIGGDSASIKIMPSNARYVRVSFEKKYQNVLSIIKDGKYDKKQISSTLRSLPSGLQDLNYNLGGRQYSVKKCGEITLIGGENIEITTTQTNTITFACYVNIGITKYSKNVYSDKFIADTGTDSDSCWVDYSNSKSCVVVKILKSKLATQDVAGFKTWLQNNPTTVVYELAQPITTELPNFNPRTFDPKTTLLINSGVVQADASFEVTNSLGSDIEVMKGKMASLDDDINRIENFDISLLNGWSNFEYAKSSLTRQGKKVSINMNCKKGILTKGTIIAKLPTKLLPSTYVGCNAFDVTGKSLGVIEIYGGKISINGTSDLLDPGGQSIIFNFNYYVD